MYNDWKLHPQSVNTYHAGIFSPAVPPLGSSNVYRVSSTTNASLQRLIYVNKLAGVINGVQELQGVFKFTSGNTDLRVGFFMMWDGVDFDDTDNAYVVEISRTPTNGITTLAIRTGTSRESEALVAAPAALFEDIWIQFAFQVKFDQQYNSELRFYGSDPAVDPVTAPVWNLGTGFPMQIPRADSKTSGQFGFFVESQQAVFDAYVDHVVMNTTPTI